jgi:hypothetical protein
LDGQLGSFISLSFQLHFGQFVVIQFIWISSIYLPPTFKENGAWHLDAILQILAVVKDVQNEKKRETTFNGEIFPFLIYISFSLTEIIKLAILYKVTTSKFENSNVLHHF